MRVFRSEKPDGPYLDTEGKDAIFQSFMVNFGPQSKTDRGVNIFGAYGDWGNMATGNLSERSQGHNSILAAEDGSTYLVYHTRFQNSGENHQVRVHQVFQNQDGWLVAGSIRVYWRAGKECRYCYLSADSNSPSSWRLQAVDT